MNNPIYKLIGYIVGIFVANGIIMWLYNAILPEMYGFKPIGYWQLFGVYMICGYKLASITFEHYYRICMVRGISSSNTTLEQKKVMADILIKCESDILNS